MTVEKYAELLFRTWLTSRIGPQTVVWSELERGTKAAWMNVADAAVKLAPSVERRAATK